MSVKTIVTVPAGQRLVAEVTCTCAQELHRDPAGRPDVDGLVYAAVASPPDRAHDAESLVDHVAPGRAATLRRPTRKELAATVVLALPLHEASVKRRAGDPLDEDFDVEAGGVWAGVLPLRVAGAEPVTSADVADVPVPEHVVRRAAGLA